MKSREHSDLPDEVLREFQNGTPDAHTRAVRVWELLDELDEQPRDIPSLQDAWDDLENRLDEQPAIATRASDRKPRKSSRAPRWRIPVVSTAVFSILLIAAFMFYREMPIVEVAPPGQQLSVLLPDGSTVVLKSGAELSYARSLGSWSVMNKEERAVFLNGEAFFNVEPGSATFSVETFNATVTVLGTAFNVRAYEEEAEQETIVTLEHGKVRVDTRQDDNESTVISDPGESVRVAQGHIDVQNNYPLDLLTAWKNNGFVAVGLSLESLINEIERQYNVEIQQATNLFIEPTELIYPNALPEIDNLLTDFCLSQGCKFQKTGSGYTLLPSE